MKKYVKTGQALVSLLLILLTTASCGVRSDGDVNTMSTASSTEFSKASSNEITNEHPTQIPAIQSVANQPLSEPENLSDTVKDSDIDTSLLNSIGIKYAQYLDENSSYDASITAVEAMIELSKSFLEDGGEAEQLSEYFQMKQANVGETSVTALFFTDSNNVFGTIEGNWTIIRVADLTGIHVFMPIERDALMTQQLFAFEGEDGIVIVLCGRLTLTRYNTVFMSSYMYSDAAIEPFTDIDTQEDVSQRMEFEQVDNVLTFTDYSKTLSLAKSSSPQEPFLRISAETDYSVTVNWDGNRFKIAIDE